MAGHLHHALFHEARNRLCQSCHLEAHHVHYGDNGDQDQAMQSDVPGRRIQVQRMDGVCALCVHGVSEDETTLSRVFLIMWLSRPKIELFAKSFA